MSQVESRASEATPEAASVKAPGVLIILVTKDGEAWLPQCLLGISRQTFPRISVIAVDNGSSDRSAEILTSALGPDRVIRERDNPGFAGAVGRAMRSDIARQADYLLFLHDDTILAPDAVANLVDAAERVDSAGIVGPKVLDAENPRVLRQIGMSTDRFGYPYSPLEAGEIDQGQYDRIREVRFVSSCAMLVSRDAWSKVGPPDERFTHTLEDLDYCWRAQIAGFHVLMAPAAVAYHRMASVEGERKGAPRPARSRYYHERGALATVLKNYGILSLLWVLPLYLIQGLVRVALLALSRRFEDASQILAAWGWNLLHLPSTMGRRLRAQAARKVSDRSIRHSMAPTGIRLRQWAGTASSAILPRREGGSDEESVPTRVRAWHLAAAHPVATAWSATIVLLLVADRNVLFANPVSGGGLAAVPVSPAGFFREFLSGIRTTGLGGIGAGSPALALMGIGSGISFGDPALFQKLLAVLLPVVGAAGCYRTARTMTDERVSAVVAAGCYGLSSLTLWAFSQGRLGALVFLAGLPWLVTKVSVAFAEVPHVGASRWIVGAGLGLAVLGSFLAGAVLAAALLALCSLATASRSPQRVRGLWWFGSAVALAGLLALPVTLGLLRAGGEGLTGQTGTRSFASILQLSLGLAPGTWATAYALPLAGAAAWLFAARRFWREAARAGLAVILAVYLAWAAGAGYLPGSVSNPTAYLGVAAIELSLLVALGLASVMQGVRQASFGRRQVGTAVLAAVLTVYLGGQAIQAAKGSWMIGSGASLPAFVAVAQPSTAPYRVLWLGRADGEPFPSPGGLPDGMVAAGRASVRFAVTLPAGASALDVGRPSAGPGYEYLRQTLAEILTGDTSHGGALLAPMGIRYVVAAPDDIPAPALRQLSRQLDLDVVFTQGLTVLFVATAAPRASVIGGGEWRQAARSSDPGVIVSLPVPDSTLLGGGGERYSGALTQTPSLVLLSQQGSGGWTMTPRSGGPSLRPVLAFGWAVGFLPPPGTTVFDIRFGGQRVKTIQVFLLALLWAAALWLTRRPIRNG